MTSYAPPKPPRRHPPKPRPLSPEWPRKRDEALLRLAKTCDTETDPVALAYFQRARTHLLLLRDVCSNRAYLKAFQDAGRDILRGYKLLGDKNDPPSLMP